MKNFIFAILFLGLAIAFAFLGVTSFVITQSWFTVPCMIVGWLAATGFMTFSFEIQKKEKSKIPNNVLIGVILSYIASTLNLFNMTASFLAGHLGFGILILSMVVCTIVLFLAFCFEINKNGNSNS